MCCSGLLHASSRFSTHKYYQSKKFIESGHMPALWSNISIIIDSVPVVTATINIGICIIVDIITIRTRSGVAPGISIRDFCDSVSISVLGGLEILGHPPWFSNPDWLVNIIVNIGHCTGIIGIVDSIHCYAIGILKTLLLDGAGILEQIVIAGTY